ncbi:MAG TPA: hypothetical protein VGG11_05760 [Xanthobacteraceae bacterium]|jgi:hypothetical protein
MTARANQQSLLGHDQVSSAAIPRDRGVADALRVAELSDTPCIFGNKADVKLAANCLRNASAIQSLGRKSDGSRFDWDPVMNLTEHEAAN